MRAKIIIIFFLVIILFSCGSKEKPMETDQYGHYIVYKEEYPKDYRTTYNSEKYRMYYLITDYGLRIDSDWAGNLKNIYLYDGKKGIEYIIKKLNGLENIMHNEFSSNIVINYYEFCSGGSGVKNVSEILQKINNILENNNIEFLYEQYDVWDENADIKSGKIIMDTCLGG